MQINCRYCHCPMEATSPKCTHCGAINEYASHYKNQQEFNDVQHRNMMDQKDLYNAKSQYLRTQQNYNSQKYVKIFAIMIYVLIGICVLSGIIIGAIGSAKEQERSRQERIEQQQKREEQLAEEKRLAEEAEKEKQEYDAQVVAVNGMNTMASKDRYYSIQVIDMFEYELHYDHQGIEWGGGVKSDKHLLDNEHRYAIQFKIISNQEINNIYSGMSSYTKLYISDENGNNIEILNEKLLNGNNDDNYYSGGTKISDTKEISNGNCTSLNKNQSYTWWIPVVLNEDQEKITFYFDYNMSITIDNPCYIAK